ncbi:HET-domain-containing protein [Lepidopterella palustris CBS 459.81]|uniref:HET-domain-containing protein n=1 Tax=Lepidopterella palustris CBS 459.81 TaxID=1314670 RepID=A0A8E2E6N2_9PEZI|nr:HET-domain-containing protein [Lepidopterella palustris CBS 459.81]
MATYPYRLLRDNEIRLLEYLPTPNLSYRLVHVDLNSNPRYAALSYTWGYQNSPVPISVDSHQLRIQQNLHDALHRLRHDEKARHLWVDAICINQRNEVEKNQQIRKMGNIYENAQAVLVWLGNPQNADLARLAFEKINTLDKMYSSHLLKANRWTFRPLSSKPKPLETFLESISPPSREVWDAPGSSTHRAWQGISMVLTTHWWSRTWVCQEATVPEGRHYFVRNGTVIQPSTRVEFIYGWFSTTWPKLANTAEVGKHLAEFGDIDFGFMKQALNNFRMMMSIRALRFQSRELDFLTVLHDFADTLCGDPRDKIYAPLCLASSSARAKVIPDYHSHKELLHVCQDVAQYYLERHELEFLAFIANPGPLISSKEWPSWLPHWQRQPDCKNFGRFLYVPDQRQTGLVFSGSTTKVYNATKESSVIARIVGLKLEVRGFHCDRVTDVFRFEVIDGTNHFERALARCDPSGHGRYFTQENFRTVLARVTTADVEYDYFYERIIRRGMAFDINVMTVDPKRRLSKQHIEQYNKHAKSLLRACDGRCMIRTSRGYIGLAHETTEIGDDVFAFLGCQVLYTVRGLSNSNYEFRQT